MQSPISFGLSDILAASAAAGFSAQFGACLRFIIPQEGVYYEVTQGDPGGATECGITWQDDAAYRREHGLPVQDLRQMGAGECARVYYAHYYAPTHGDDLSLPLALCLCDCAVNVGLGRAVVWVQQTVGASPDGAFGPATLAQTRAWCGAHGGETALAETLLARRRAYYEALGAPGTAYARFLQGWLTRCDALTQALRAQAASLPGLPASGSGAGWRLLLKGQDAGALLPRPDGGDAGHLYVAARAFLSKIYPAPSPGAKSVVDLYLSGSDGKNGLTWNGVPLTTPQGAAGISAPIPTFVDGAGQTWAQLAALCGWLRYQAVPDPSRHVVTVSPALGSGAQLLTTQAGRSR